MTVLPTRLLVRPGDLPAARAILRQQLPQGWDAKALPVPVTDGIGGPLIGAADKFRQLPDGSVVCDLRIDKQDALRIKQAEALAVSTDRHERRETPCPSK